MAEAAHFSSDDERWMRRALALAEETAALASPNPRVGCVLVRDGAVVGEGAHVYDDYDHAEIVALKRADDAARGATAYVSLEPCSHHGRTGPCADALIAAGVARVVAATVDPNPLVSGRGVARLLAEGVRVEVGLLQDVARGLNDGFARFVREQRPFVTLKAAVSADGKIAPARQERGWPVWISGDSARSEVQRMRHASDAILTGIGTVLMDDPALTDRTELPRRRRLLRVVLDAELRIPLESHLVRSVHDDVLLFAENGVEPERAMVLEAKGVMVAYAPSLRGRLDLRVVLEELARRQILSLLVEGGSRVNAGFLREDLVGKVVVFHSAKKLGDDGVPFAEGLELSEVEARLQRASRRRLDEDICVSGYLQDAWSGADALG